MPGLEEVLEAHGPVATQERDFGFLLRDMLQHRRLVGDLSNALDAEPLPAPASDRPTVLVVDDDATLLATLADMLGRAFRVVTAASGTDAIATFRTTPVDVVVTDLAMPDMNGLQVARQCKAIRPTVPILMVTAWEALVSPEDASAHGIDGILTKPVRAGTLVRAVQDLLG